MASELSIKTTVTLCIAGCVLVTQTITGFVQYFDLAASRLAQIRSVDEAVMQPVAELAARGVDGGNLMILENQEAKALYGAAHILYLKIEGRSAGQEATPFTEAIPPQPVATEHVAAGADAARLRAVAAAAGETGLDEASMLFVVKLALPQVKNGAEAIAVFSADQLSGLRLEVARQVGLLTLAVSALALLVAWFFGGRLAAPMARISAQTKAIADSLDLRERVKLTRLDTALNHEAGITAAAFNHLLDNLQTTLREVSDNIGKVAGASKSLTGSARQVAASSEKQSDATASVAAAVQQAAVSLAEIARNAHDADAASRQSGELSQEGGQIIRQAAQEMTAIADIVRRASASFDDLERSSDEISAIVQVIQEIADQTNLLALNAAIEAARAGEQGRGFAVVADEVRKLAERTSESTQRIGGMIAAIQGSADGAVRIMDSANARVETGVDLARRAGGATDQINLGAVQVRQRVEEIAGALKQQNSANEDIGRHVESIAAMTEQNSRIAADTAAASHRLEDLTRAMEETVGRFRV